MKSYGSIITVRIPEAVHAELKSRARHMGGSVSQLVRETLGEPRPPVNPAANQQPRPDPSGPTDSV